LFHTLEDEIHAEALAPFHAEAVRADVVFLLDAFLFHLFIGPLNGAPVLKISSILGYN
jgi:hypothetical protein